MTESAMRATETAPSEKPRGFFARIFTFLSEVIAELRKVTRPTGSELLRYTLTVLVFVIIMMLLVMGLDFLFGQGAVWVFGGPPQK